MGDSTRRTLASLAAVLLLATASLAAADDDPYGSAAPTATGVPGPIPGPPSRPAVPQWKLDQQYKTLNNEGQKLIQQERWQEALDKFREAKAIRSEPKLLLWIAYLEAQLGHLRAAKELYTQAKEDAQRLKLKQEEEAADQALTELLPKIPRIALKLPKGPEAKVSLDANPIPFNGEDLEVEPGKHEIEVTWPSRPLVPPFQREVEAKVGEVSAVEVVMPPEPPPPQPPPEHPKKEGCGACRVGGASERFDSAAALTALGLAAAFGARRRRRRFAGARRSRR